MGRRRSRSYSRSSSPSPSPSRSPCQNKFRVHVADLGIEPSRRDLIKQFEKFGKITDIWVAKNPPCFAFIVYRYKKEADMAIKEMNGQVLSGGRIRVTYARPRTRGRKGQSFDPSLRCYQCGKKGHFSRDCNDIWGSKRRYSRRSYSRSRSRSPSRRSRHRVSQSRGHRHRSRSPSSRSKSRSSSRESRRQSSHSSGRRSYSRERRRHNRRSRSRDQRSRNKNRTSHRSRSYDRKSHSKTQRSHSKERISQDKDHKSDSKDDKNYSKHNRSRNRRSKSRDQNSRDRSPSEEGRSVKNSGSSRNEEKSCDKVADQQLKSGSLGVKENKHEGNSLKNPKKFVLADDTTWGPVTETLTISKWSLVPEYQDMEIAKDTIESPSKPEFDIGRELSMNVQPVRDSDVPGTADDASPTAAAMQSSPKNSCKSP